ncbi:MAG: SET domain-containing protein [Candidatus Woesearchaeota archaeon]
MEYVVVKKSGIHNKGVFAKQDIKRGTHIIEYVGRKITKKESDAIADKQLEKSRKNAEDGAVYVFTLNKRYDIDGNVSWNPARYINHSCSPNAQAVIDNGHIWIVATKRIQKGEEITYDYGYDVDNYTEHPCRCGSKNCIGYIVAKDQWPKLKRRLRSQ